MLPTIIVNKLTSSNLLLKKVISLTDSSNSIIVGDWNTTLNLMDKQGELAWKETKYRNSLVYFMKAANLVDIYHKIHPKNKTYTYE